jgi:hypothetical protein
MISGRLTFFITIVSFSAGLKSVIFANIKKPARTNTNKPVSPETEYKKHLKTLLNLTFSGTMLLKLR